MVGLLAVGNRNTHCCMWYTPEISRGLEAAGRVWIMDFPFYPDLSSPTWASVSSVFRIQFHLGKGWLPSTRCKSSRAGVYWICNGLGVDSHKKMPVCVTWLLFVVLQGSMSSRNAYVNSGVWRLSITTLTRCGSRYCTFQANKSRGWVPTKKQKRRARILNVGFCITCSWYLWKYTAIQSHVNCLRQYNLLGKSPWKIYCTQRKVKSWNFEGRSLVVPHAARRIGIWFLILALLCHRNIYFWSFCSSNPWLLSSDIFRNSSQPMAYFISIFCLHECCALSFLLRQRIRQCRLFGRLEPLQRAGMPWSSHDHVSP